MPQFQDQVAPGSGTPLNATALNALVVAQNYLITGTAPASGGAATAITMPPQTVVITNGSSASSSYALTATTVTGTATASATNYIDAKSDGSGYVWAVGAVSGTNMRLYTVPVNGAGVISSVTLAAPTYPIGTAMVPAGTANGLATLDGNARVAQAMARGVRQFLTSTQNIADVTFSNNNVSGSLAIGDWSSVNSPMYQITMNGLSGSTVLVGVSANVSSSNTVTNVLRLAAFRSVDTIVQLMVNNSQLAQNQWYNLTGFTLFTGQTGSQIYSLYSQGGGAVPSITARVNTQPGTDSLLFFAAELG